jgi:hypothetical protein
VKDSEDSAAQCSLVHEAAKVARGVDIQKRATREVETYEPAPRK